MWLCGWAEIVTTEGAGIPTRSADDSLAPLLHIRPRKYGEGSDRNSTRFED